jgi:sulfite exporter TauE/SafE
MNPNEIAFFIGLFSSVHCVGMCGPLAFAIPVKQGRPWLLLWDKLSYNFGRVVTYALLGLLVGLLGEQLWLSGLQRWISLITGVMVIITAVSKLTKFATLQNKLIARAVSPLNRLLVLALQKGSGHFVVGLLNGLLPCGFVYLALAGAVGVRGVGSAIQYMFFFGLGTFPLMLLLTVGSGFINQGLRRSINRFAPYLMLFIGVWFMLRGLQLNVPYLSPPPVAANNSMCR